MCIFLCATSSDSVCILCVAHIGRVDKIRGERERLCPNDDNDMYGYNKCVCVCVSISVCLCAISTNIRRSVRVKLLYVMFKPARSSKTEAITCVHYWSNPKTERATAYIHMARHTMAS